MYRVIYSSVAAVSMPNEELERILTTARSANEEQDITGVLIYVDGTFLQVLEGEKAALGPVIGRIVCDRRHRHITFLHVDETDSRTLAQWRMAYLNPNLEDLSDWASLEGTVTGEALVAELQDDPTRINAFLGNLIRTLA